MSGLDAGEPAAGLAIVLVAAGASTRMGFDKLWADLGGRPVLAHALEACLAASPAELVLVVSPTRLGDAGALLHAVGASLTARTQVVAGGARRRDSAQRGLEAVQDASLVAIHDAARALVPPTLFGAGWQAARATGAAVPVVPVTDTIKRVANGYVEATLSRASLAAVQTPQVFARDLLTRALAATDDDATDEAGLMERLGTAVATFPGHAENFKITTPLDLALARVVLDGRRAGARSEPAAMSVA